MSASYLIDIIAQELAQHNTPEAAMLPELGSVAWKRESLHAEATRLENSAAYHREQATLAEYPTTRDEDLNCAAQAALCAQVLRTVANALWPPERGLDLPTGIVAAYLDGLDVPLAPPLTRPEAREDVAP